MICCALVIAVTLIGLTLGKTPGRRAGCERIFYARLGFPPAVGQQQ